MRVAGRAAATATVDADDPLWRDRPGRAHCVHRIAVRRGYAGLGSRILSWVADRARAEGCEFVRLDCVADNAALVRYYLTQGFVPRGMEAVSGGPGQRDIGPSSSRTTVVRLERTILAKDSP